MRDTLTAGLQPVSPADNDVTGPSPLFSWSPPATEWAPLKYQLQIALDASFSGIVANQDGSTVPFLLGTVYLPASGVLQTGQTYYWRVRVAPGSPLAGEWSAIRSFSVSSSPPVDIKVVLQGSCRPDAGWEVPLTIKLFTPGEGSPVDVLTTNPAFTFNRTATRSGTAAVARLTGIPPAVYDIAVASEHTLTSVIRGVDLANYTCPLNFGMLLEGDANGDHIIDIHDFGLLACAFGKSTGETDFDARADFDRDGRITIADFGLLAVNYGKTAPVEAS